MAFYSQFFNKNSSEKTKYGSSDGFGYSSFPHKEGLRYLTGWKLDTQKHLVPNEMSKPLHILSKTLDDFILKIAYVLSLRVFNSSFKDVVTLGNLPEKHFGMIDCAHYYNQKTNNLSNNSPGNSVEDVNCVPHYDPGLFSFSFYSNSPGLQLFDPRTGEWVNGPVNTNKGEENMGVIWLGSAAVQNNWKKMVAGMHRVTYPEIKDTSRVTIWYEMCTNAQAKSLGDSLMTPGNVTPSHLPFAQPVKVKPGTTKVDFLKKLEKTKGVPMSKSGMF